MTGLQQPHVLVEIALHIGNTGRITGVLIRLNIEQAEVAGQDIALEIHEPAHRCIPHKLDQAFALDDIEVHRKVLHAGR